MVSERWLRQDWMSGRRELTGTTRNKKHYTVTDAQEAGITLEPLICPKCKSTKNVVYDSRQQIGFCEKCGHVNRVLNKK